MGIMVRSSAAVCLFTMGEDVVMAVELRDGAERAQAVPIGSLLIIHLNRHPRPSFTVAPGVPAEMIGDLLMERFLFEPARANHLGRAIAASAAENGVSAVDRRRLDDGARALAAVEPALDDTLAWRRYVEELQSAVAAMQSLDDLGPDANKKAWNDLLALQEKWKKAERKLAELRGKRG